MALGEYSPNAYIKIVNIAYNPTAIIYNLDGTINVAPEIEIEIHIYRNKRSREMEIIKNNFSEDQFKKLDNGDHKPIQTMKFATRDLSIFGITPDMPLGLVPNKNYIYEWIKSHHVVGSMYDVRDDFDTEATILALLKKKYPELTNG